MRINILFPALTLLLTACSNAPLQPPGAGHLRAEKIAAPDPASIPSPVQQVMALPKPKSTPKVETYSVVVNNVSVQELLFALARDAKVNIDIYPGIEGKVTLNAIDQTLQQLLARIAKQVDIRWELDGPNLSVMPDKPFLRTYKIDFLNMARTVKSAISATTQIASAAGTGAAAGATAGNTASTSVTSDTKNDLMESLIRNVTDMLKEEDRLLQKSKLETGSTIQARSEGSGTLAAGVTAGNNTANQDGSRTTGGPGGFVSASGSQQVDNKAVSTQTVAELDKAVHVFANRETGVLIVRATKRQHEKVQQFIDQVMNTAKRQVLIEATIVEVTLNDNYKQGINWSALRTGSTGFQFSQEASAGLSSTNPLNIFTLSYANPTSALGNLAAQLTLLESFGNVKVLSSPKLSVMNNQTATLKVADSKIYFTVKAETNTNSNIATTTFTTTPNSVSVGFIMNVTPQVSDSDEVTINIRPTITRIIGYVNDPNPSLAVAGVINRVPEIQTREMESIIKISSGQIAVMGGLMQEEVNNATDAIPAASQLPIFGNLFKHRNDTSGKTELVIFLKPIVIKDASLHGDYSEYKDHLPDQNFFNREGAGRNRQVYDFGSDRR